MHGQQNIKKYIVVFWLYVYYIFYDFMVYVNMNKNNAVIRDFTY